MIPIKFKHLYKLGRFYLEERDGTIYYMSQPDYQHTTLSSRVGCDIVYWAGGFEFNSSDPQVLLRPFVWATQIGGPDLFGHAGMIPRRAPILFCLATPILTMPNVTYEKTG